MDAPQQPQTVLLIEDESIIRMGTAAMLEDAGFHVVEACDGDEALDILRGHPEITLVVTDVQMPGQTDGLALVEIIGRDYPHIHTLVTSGRANGQEAREYGADQFLPKPYTSAAIQSAVQTLLHSA